MNQITPPPLQSFPVEGMTCASCVRRVEKAIAAVPGVLSASVNLATERATVKAVGGTPFTSIEAAIRKAGYEPHRLDAGAAAADAQQLAKKAEYRRLQRDFWIAAVLTLPLFVLEMGSHVVPGVSHWLHGIDRFTLHVFYFVLASIVLVMSGLVIGSGLLYMVLARSHVNGDAPHGDAIPGAPAPATELHDIPAADIPALPATPSPTPMPNFPITDIPGANSGGPTNGA